MIYSTPEFFLLLAATLAAYALARGQSSRFWVLLASSIAFYAWAGVFHCAVFVFVVAVSWAAVFLAHHQPRRKQAWLSFGVAVMLLHLFIWKYAAWVIAQIQALEPGFLGGRVVQIPLPVGISFFTLQGVAYLVDYARGDASYMSLKEYLLFKSFFAQLVAGPIVRSKQLLPQLRGLRPLALPDMAPGLALFSLGFFKKVLIADRVALFVDPVFEQPATWGRTALLLGIAGYTVQIWADFSGYTDMGRGCARMLGIRLPENFLTPYLARRPSEFWRRWHVTLSEWIRDYLYIPLGGSRGTPLRVASVALTTMAISGLWHGANWTFVAWGLYHGLLLVYERRAPDLPFSGFAADAARRAAMLGATMFGWLIFRCQDLSSVAVFIQGIVSDGGSAPHHAKNVWGAIVLCAGIEVCSWRDLETGRWPARESFAAAVCRARSFWPTASHATALTAGAAAAAALIGSIILRSPAAKAFIYFQF